ncbi:Hypothetical protein HDN1F_21340 [gamma proteobacterium HdN1]|nr:Hypothetical protein HDN1F_21340 [gamma proteobacterium HdN1]
MIVIFDRSTSERDPKGIPMNAKKLTDLALQQLDNLGYQLRTRGITSKVTRHDLAAFAMAQKDRLAGEKSRLELHVELQKARALKLRDEAEALTDKYVAHLPQVLAEPAGRIKQKVFHG